MDTLKAEGIMPPAERVGADAQRERYACTGSQTMKICVLAVMAGMFCALVIVGCAPKAGEVLLTQKQAVYENQPPDVDPRVQKHLEVVTVRYVDDHGVDHPGQVVIHTGLADDIREVFRFMHSAGFPVASVLPIAHPEIQKKGPYGISPCTDNTSGYVWRPGVGLGTLSMHGLGMAIDINPHINPYIKGDLVLPPGAVYDPEVPGTFTPTSPVVLLFKKLGWIWGGDWSVRDTVVDYMHFEKIPPGWEDWVEEMRGKGR